MSGFASDECCWRKGKYWLTWIFLQEAERAKEEQDARERDIALGNPLLNKQDFTMKRRWDDDVVVFKNQARGTEDKGKKEFVNVSHEHHHAK